MPNLNKCLLMGNFTRDPALRYTPNGKAVAQFGLAINRQWKSESGEKMEEVAFVDVEAWGKQAEVIGQYLKKGMPFFVEGRLKLDSWEDKKTGQKVSKLKVVLESFQFIGQKGGRSDEPPSVQMVGQNVGKPVSEPTEAPADDDVPF